MKRKLTLPALKKRVWKLMSEWVRRRAADEHGIAECYTCGDTYDWRDLHAGHLVGGRTGSVLLEADGIRPQCVRCNIFLAGNHAIFALKLADELGRARVDELLELRHRVKKWSRNDLEALQTELRAKLEEL